MRRLKFEVNFFFNLQHPFSFCIVVYAYNLSSSKVFVDENFPSLVLDFYKCCWSELNTKREDLFTSVGQKGQSVLRF